MKQIELNLQPRELDVLKLTAQGKNAKQTASLLSMTPATVRSYRQRIYEKLGLEQNSVALLTHLAIAKNLITNQYA